jgi:hypothetical protein
VEAPGEALPALAPASIRKAYPLKGIMQGRDGPLALIGGTMLRPGDEIDERARVVEIAAEYLVLEVDQVRYRLRMR